MLVLTRRKSEEVFLFVDEDLCISVKVTDVDPQRGKVRLAFDAPPSRVRIVRSELKGGPRGIRKDRNHGKGRKR